VSGPSEPAKFPDTRPAMVEINPVRRLEFNPVFFKIMADMLIHGPVIMDFFD
jgi:hypothetical protein